MNKYLIVLLTLFWLVLSGCGWGWNAKPSWDSAQVCNQAQCFKVDVADTVEKQGTWLMGVESLESDEWMLFAFESPGVHKFWMKNTLIPLDMIWLSDTGEVLYIKEYAPPCTEEDSAKDDCQLFGPPDWTQAKYVLEVNANSTREAGIYEGLVLDMYNVE